MDIGDDARHREELFRELALERQLEKRPTSEGKARRNCIDCGELIPRARKKAVPGVKRCLECQEDFERMKT